MEISKKILLILCLTPLLIFPMSQQMDYNRSNVKSLFGNPQLSFSVISDIHLHAGKSDFSGFPYHDYIAEKKFAAALQDLNDIDPNLNALVINGDLTATGMQTDYDSMNKVLRKMPHSKNTLFAIGNHEFYSAFRSLDGRLSTETFPNGVTEKRCIDRFLENTHMPNLYYDTWVKGYRFIVLGSEKSRISNFNNLDNAILSDTQLNWLEKQLEGSLSDKPIFIFLHHPIPHTVAGSEDNYIINSGRLLKILNKYPQVIFFSGHSHMTLTNQSRTIYKKYFTMINSSSVRNPTFPESGLLRGSEGLYIQVYKDKVVVNGRNFIKRLWINRYIIKIQKKQTIYNDDTVRTY